MKNDIIIERDYLNKTLFEFQNVSKLCNQRLYNYIKHYNENSLLYSKLIYETNHKINLIKRLKDKPYFARIVFKDNSNNDYNCYISKVGILDDDNNPITIDWRSPIASLYYDANVGDASYISPDGLIEGTLNLKRQFDIQDGNLISMQDIDVVANDELLKPYLTVSNDNRLKNIISTIQNEQNEIIRKNILDNIIVQGVAGSGKTTVALHRIAYLAYTYEKSIKPTEYLVIGPNKYFVKYISDVLPDLDVDEVKQIVFDDILDDYISCKYHINNSEINMQKALDGEDLSYLKYKGSIEFKDYIDNYLDQYIKDLYIDKELYDRDIRILDSNIINTYYNLKNNNEVLINKINQTIILLKKYIKDNAKNISNKIINKLFETQNGSFNDYKKNINSLYSKQLKDFFNIKNINIINIYIDILKSNTLYDYKDSIEKLNKKIIDPEDIPALIYIGYRIFGNKEYDKYKHTVIDEAQDYSPFNFYVLSKILNNSTFSIYGDLAQSLYSYKSILSWDEVLNIIKGTEICYLNKSYRTTTNIMNFANRVNRHLGLKEAENVLRNGENVSINKQNSINDLYKIIDENINLGYRCAVIVKDAKAKEKLKQEINPEYLEKITLITSTMVKGLEFDSIILLNVDNDNYNINNILDMKLLYVSLTRALHKLDILYNNSLCEILK